MDGDEVADADCDADAEAEEESDEEVELDGDAEVDSDGEDEAEIAAVLLTTAERVADALALELPEAEGDIVGLHVGCAECVALAVAERVLVDE